VEIFVPAVGFGLIYLALGLLPAIVLHFAVDVVFISLPVFASDASGIWLDRAMVVVLALVPLWVVLRGRWKSGRWGDVAAEDTNAAWRPPAAPVVEDVAAPAPVAAGIDGRLRAAVLIAGALAVFGWIAASDFSSDAPPIEVGRSEVVAASRRVFAERAIDIPPSWRELTNVSASVDIAHRFVWQEGGEETYRALLGSYLEEPAWFVRRALFEGDVAERAEEYVLWFGGDGRLRRFRHQLPQQREGEELTEAAARTLARANLAAVHGLDPDELDEISADAEQHDRRRDWRFVYSEPDASEMSSGDARIAVHIAGDEIVDSYRFVHVPEDWERAERDRRTLAQVVQIVCTVTMVLVFLAGAVFAIVRWSRGRFAVATFGISSAVLFGLGVAEVVNSWPTVTASFSTAQPYSLQASIVLFGSLLAMLVIAVAVGLGVGLVHRWVQVTAEDGTGRSLLLGVSLGALAACLVAVAGAFGTPAQPEWGTYQAASALIPVVAGALGPMSSWITTSTLLLLVLSFVQAVGRGWTRLRLAMGLVLVIFGLMMTGAGEVETISRWLAGGIAFGLLLLVCYVLILRRHMALVPVVTAVVSILATVREGTLRLYPGSLVGGVVAALLIALAASYWMRRFTRDSAESEMSE
jgi:hypothetical protein